MSYNFLFSLSGLLVMPFWFLMIVLPHWRVTRWIARSPWIAAGPAVIYALLVTPRAAGLLDEFGSLSKVTALLGSPFGALVGWMHFLAFDLFVGRWAYRDSRERNISALLMAPVLFFIFMLGPIGFLAYLGLRAVHAFSQRPHPGAAAARQLSSQ